MIDFKKLAEKNHEYTVNMRRYFHRHPELSTREVNTSKKICEELAAMGIPFNVYPDYTVIATIDSGKKGNTVLIRGDIDALPITEETGLPFASQNPGVMHACGHDSHAAMLLGIAKSLWEVKKDLNGKILLGFQVAEENLKGSRTLVKYVKEMGGADYSLAIHVGNSAETGTVIIVPGPFAAGVVTYKVYMKGQGGHGSRPHASKDPIKPACDFLLKLAALPSNSYDAKDPIVFSSCTIQGGSGAPNIIPDEAYVFGTVRYFNKSLTEKIKSDIENLARCTAKSYGVESVVEYPFDTMLPVVNDENVAKICTNVAKDMGLNIISGGMGMGSDDMALVLDAFPGVYANLGTANLKKGIGHISNHSSKFTIDEDALKIGTEFLMKSARKLLNK
jgi:amidohydrolase